MNLVLTGAVTPPSTKALLSPGTLTTQTATLTHPPAPTPVPVPVPVPTAQPPPPPLWDCGIHALVQAQAQAAQAVQAQAQVAQAQAVQAQAIRNQDFWLTMALASNPSPTSSTPASSSSAAAAAVAAAATNKSLALTGSNSAIQVPAAAYAVAPPTAVALHAPPTATSGAATPFLLFNLPHHPHHRIPILRTPTPHGLLAPIMHTAPTLNPAAIMGLKRTWDNAFSSEATAGSVVKRTWHTPTAATFHAPAPTANPALPYPAQFYPQI